MAFNPSPQVAAARNFAKQFRKQQVIIIAIGDGMMEYASYGETPNLCADTRKLADIAYDALMDEFKRRCED